MSQVNWRLNRQAVNDSPLGCAISRLDFPTGVDISAIENMLDLFLTVGRGCSSYTVILTVNTVTSTESFPSVYGINKVSDKTYNMMAILFRPKCPNPHK